MRAVLVPGVLALLPEYAGLEDPVAELRAACLGAAAWLGPDVVILADPQGERVGRSLLAGAGGFEAQAPGRLRTSTTDAVVEVRGAPATSLETTAPGTSYLVVGNGSAMRSEKAPGHLDERAHAFDAALGASLCAGRPDVDAGLAHELWASVDGIARMRGLGDLGAAQVDYDHDPFGVQYWVMRWEW